MCRIVELSSFALNTLSFSFVLFYLPFYLSLYCRVIIVEFSSGWKLNIAFPLKTPTWVQSHVFLIHFMWVFKFDERIESTMSERMDFFFAYSFFGYDFCILSLLTTGTSSSEYINTDWTNRQRYEQQFQVGIIQNSILRVLAEIANKGWNSILCWSS